MHKVENFSDNSFQVRTHEFDMDILLRRMSMGFCIVDCYGRIHASNRQFHISLGQYSDFFITWWKKSVNKIRSREGYVLSDVVLVEDEFSLPGKRERRLGVWIFLMGNACQTACIFINDTKSLDVYDSEKLSDVTSFSSKEINAGMYRSFNDSIFQALKNNEFSIQYQPIQDIRSGKITGFDALLRWHRSPHDELISPRFLDLLETTGGSLVLGIWLVGNVCRQVQRWNRIGNGQEKYCVHLNMSLNLLGSPCMLGALTSILDAYAVDPSWLWIENSKTTFDCRIDDAKLLLHRYHAVGVNFVVDDLQIRLSDLSYFFRFSLIPFKAVKIVESPRKGENSEAEIESFTTFVKIFSSLGILVVAKGITTAEALSALSQTCCRYAQGNEICEAMNAEDAEKIIGRQKSAYPPIHRCRTTVDPV